MHLAIYSHFKTSVEKISNIQTSIKQHKESIIFLFVASTRLKSDNVDGIIGCTTMCLVLKISCNFLIISIERLRDTFMDLFYCKKCNANIYEQNELHAGGGKNFNII